MYSRGRTPEPEEPQTSGLFGWFNSFFQPEDIRDDYVPPEIPIERNLFKDYQEPSYPKQEPLPTREPYREERRTPKYFKHSYSRTETDPFSRYKPERPESFSRHATFREPASETREEFVYNDTDAVRTALEEIDTSIDIIRQLGDATHTELLNQLLALKQNIRDNPQSIKKWDKSIWYKMLGEACSKGDKTSCFKIFGLTGGASCDQIKKKYYKLIQKNHPDHKGDARMAQIINDAYDKICGN